MSTTDDVFNTHLADILAGRTFGQAIVDHYAEPQLPFLIRVAIADTGRALVRRWVAADRPSDVDTVRGLLPTGPVTGSDDITHPDLVVLVDWMASEGGFCVDDIAHAVRKPWNYRDELALAREWLIDQVAAETRKATTS